MLRRTVLGTLLLTASVVARPAVTHAATNSINTTVVATDLSVRTDPGTKSWSWRFTGTAVGTSAPISFELDMGFTPGGPFCLLLLDDHQGGTLVATCTLPFPLGSYDVYLNPAFYLPLFPYGGTGRFFGLLSGNLTGVTTMAAVVLPAGISARPPAVLLGQLQLS
jgi:hypothetical protein